MTFTRPHPAVITAVIDVAVIGASLADGLLTVVDGGSAAAIACAVIASAGLLVRRRFPIVAFALTLPGLFLSATVVAAAVATCSVARRTPRLGVVGVVAAVVFVGNFSYIGNASVSSLLVNLTYSTIMALGPVALGRLMRVRVELSDKIEALNAARQHEADAVAEHVLSQERARLAREMHDVVSHQVSLIAVQAGVLRVRSDDDAVTAGAEKIRSLAVETLDELRQMVSVLRAAGGLGEGTRPQPTGQDIDTLIAESGISIRHEIALPTTLSAAAQRAVFRTIQEALTNVRKHAPGATVTIATTTTNGVLRLAITNSSTTSAPLGLPSAGHGLIGLTERAEHLGGTLTAAPTGTGGFRIELAIPA
ncbi:sensor histidine kinase [Williamsia maris]|uniref:histidine kinase n=1 Tax=Williamsia maris TaxID=72806 RepID=A0ABT1HCZ1_9NOCA|nr:histidine kinase [Williamsia maris]MCP2175541.1 Signal transduction histidine kinase [Williamsia maris]